MDSPDTDRYRKWYQDSLNTVPRANKNLGQHFIYDFAILRKIVQFANLANAETVFEIGPGAGGLTAAILETGVKRLIAIEKDESLAVRLKSLQKLAGEKYFAIISQDARKFDMSCGKRPAIIIANLPYHAATYLLNLYLDEAHQFSQMVLMFQREVGCRLTARPFSGEYGRLSVLAQSRAEIKTMMTLPAGAFKPAPKVASSVMKFTMRDLPELDYPALKTVTSLLFAQRRKKMQTVLSRHGIEKSQWRDAPVDGSARIETLTPQDCIRLANWASGSSWQRF